MSIYQQTIDTSTLLLTQAGRDLGVGLHDFDPISLNKRELVIAQKQGRGQVFFFTLAKANNEQSFALRHYCRGGLMAKLSYDKFLYTSVPETRCYEELAILEYLTQHHVNVPKPIAAKITRRGIFYTSDLITEVVPETKELHELIATKPLSTEDWEKIGQQIRLMHNALVCHDDINVKNILLQEHEGDSRVFLIDFDKCTIKSEGEKGWQQKNVERLKRSITKQQKLHHEYFCSEQNWDALMFGYQKAT